MFDNSSPMTPASETSLSKVLGLSFIAGLLLTLASCGGGSGGSGSGLSTPTGARLTAIQHGKLVDVYGFKTLGGAKVVELFQSDMLVGPDIQDERDSGSNQKDEEILYDFISANPDTLQPRLLITREIGSEDFANAVEDLDDNIRLISPDAFGKNSTVSPYSVVPRNSAIRLVFSEELGITDDFFYEKDALGKVVGVKNTQAVQLLKIIGDPNNSDPTGDFQIIDSRIAVRDNLIIVDPVLLGTEGLQYGARNTASGMPESPNQVAANIRLAVASDGPLSIPNIGTDPITRLNGSNNNGFVSIVRDFRSGNSNDNSSDLSRGFIRDPNPPRLIGQMLMYLEKVEAVGTTAKLLTIFKDGIEHEFDRGDLVRIFADNSGIPVASLEVLQEPQDDLGKPEVQRVRILVRPVLNSTGGDVLEMIDPSEDPNFPPFANAARSAFLRQYAPKAILVAEYTRRRQKPVGHGSPEPFYGDDPRNFLGFNPRPLPADSGVVIANENVSPFAGAILRFSKPIDMTTLIAVDTVFFGTRNVLDEQEIEDFITSRGIDPGRFNEAKFRTPHLIHSRIFDEDGSQTAVRVQPTLGFYIDQAMRDAAEQDKNLPFEDRRYRYFLHLMSGSNGITDLSGNPLDFQSTTAGGGVVTDHLVLPFSLDSRTRPGTQLPRYEDNLAVYIVRRFADPDEDERPSLYLDTEITRTGGLTPANGWESKDFFGPISYLPSGELVSRNATRITKVVDNLNQVAAPPQTSELRWCPITAGSGFASPIQIVFQTAATAFGQPIRNPVNPFGCRLQMAWREIDMSLSRTDPLDFNLDVEQLYWAPFAQNTIVFDEFDQMTLYLGHAEKRMEACIRSGSAFPSMPGSGLGIQFNVNYATNKTGVNNDIIREQRHPAYVDATMTISPKDAILETNGVNRYLPLPKFIDASTASNLDNPYFVWRDELKTFQGGVNGLTAAEHNPFPYLLGPFLSGKGRAVTGDPTSTAGLTFVKGGWHNARDWQLRGGELTDTKTGGCVGTIALPLLADFWTYPDDPDKPVSNPFRAGGVNGWQVSLPITSSSTPNFRVYSAGKGGSSPLLVDPTSPRWLTARGGFQPGGATTPPADNTLYWIMADFLKRTSVVTGGFVDIADPHRMPATGGDPRLGPFDTTDMVPTYTYDFEPPLTTLPGGTSILTEFSGASQLSRLNNYWPTVKNNTNSPEYFPLDPLKAGDSQIRHWDTRNIQGSGTRRRWWTYMYNETVTPYTEDPNDLADIAFTNKDSGPYETFKPEDVKYFNWRFIIKNNVEASPPISPKIESFAVAYRLSKIR
jgi:hypothetical protein